MNWLSIFVFVSIYSLCSGGVIVQKRSTDDDQDEKESMYGRFVIDQLLGTGSGIADLASYQPANRTDLTYIIGDYIFQIFQKEDKTFAKNCKEILLNSQNLEEKLQLLKEISARLERIATGSTLKGLLLKNEIFLEQQAKVSKNAAAMQTNENPCNGPVPDLGKVNGFYGDPATLSMQEEMEKYRKEIGKSVKDNGMQLAMIDFGFAKPKLETRLGAFEATRGYKSGSVGSTIHSIVGGMFLILGPAGEEKIGRIYNDPAVKGFLSQPIESDAIRCLAYIEELYYKNVKKENPQSVGAAVGSVVTPRTRDCLTKLVAGILCS